MGKDKDKKGKKNSQLIIRLNKEEKNTFLDLCDEIDTSAAREVRRFIREFVREHGGSGDEKKGSD